MLVNYTVNSVGYVISNARITGFQTENLYESSSFNRSGIRFEMEGEGFITSTNAGTSITTITNVMNTPRGTLYIAWLNDASYTLITSAATDSRNGPLPSIQIIEMIGVKLETTFKVKFKFSWYGCAADPIQRFELTQRTEIDQSGFATLHREGILVLSSANADLQTPALSSNSNSIAGEKAATPFGSSNVGSCPDLYRNIVCGQPPSLYVRARQQYGFDPTLTTLIFSTEDKMCFRDLPSPALTGDASFKYQRSLSNMLGQKTFSGWVEGDAYTDPKDLLAILFDACKSRINFYIVIINGVETWDLIQSIQVTEPNLYTRNRVELQVEAQGTEDGLVQISTIKSVFSRLNTLNYSSKKVTGAYPKDGLVMGSLSHLKHALCTTTAGISPVIANIVGQDEYVDIYVTTANDLEPDPPPSPTEIDITKEDIDAMQKDGKVVSHQAVTARHVISTGVCFLKTIGGKQYPYQIELPVVEEHQTMTITCRSENPPIPWQDPFEPHIVKSSSHVVTSTQRDASGRFVYAIMAERVIQVQTATSLNTYITETGVPMRVYSPRVIASPRAPYQLANNVYATTNDFDKSGDGQQELYTGNGGALPT